MRLRRSPGRPIGEIARHASTGPSLPFARTGPTCSYWMTPLVASCVTAPTSTPPGSAAAWSRLAVFTASPVAV